MLSHKQIQRTQHPEKWPAGLIGLGMRCTEQLTMVKHDGMIVFQPEKDET